MKKFNWGILGCGWIAEQFATDLAFNDSSNIYAVAARDLERAQTFAKKHTQGHSAPLALNGYHELLSQPEIDIIYIALPHTFHFEWAKAALTAGKSILVEKPFTLNAQQAAQLFDIARQRSLFVMEAFWTKFYPPIVQAAERIRENSLGKPQHLTATFNLQRPFDPEHRLYDLNLGGGALLDIGVYPLELALWLFDKPSEWEVTHKFSETGVDSEFAVNAQWQDGKTATLSAALNQNNSPSDVTLKANEGTLHIPDLWINAAHFTVERSGETHTITPEFSGYGLRFQALEVERCLSLGTLQSEQHSWQDTLDLLQWCDAIRKQWRLTYPGEL